MSSTSIIILCTIFAYMSILIGVGIWKYAIRPLGGIFDIYELLPAFLISFVAIVIVSLLTKAPSQEIMDEFEKAKGIIK